MRRTAMLTFLCAFIALAVTAPTQAQYGHANYGHHGNAYGYIFVSPEAKLELQADFERLHEHIAVVKKKIQDCVGDSSQMDQLLVYDETRYNGWQLAEIYKNPFSSVKTSILNKLPFNNSAHVASLRNKLTAICGDIQSDAHRPNISERTKAFLKLNNGMLERIETAANNLERKIASKDGEKYAALSDQARGTVYTGLTGLIRSIETLQPIIAADCKTVLATPDAANSIVYGYDGGNHWKLADKHRLPMKSLVKTLEAHRFTLSQRGLHSGLSVALRYVKQHVTGKVHMDRGSANTEEKQIAIFQLRDDYLPTALRMLKEEIEVFKTSVPNSEALIAQYGSEAGAAGDAENVAGDVAATVAGGMMGQTEEAANNSTVAATDGTAATVEGAEVTESDPPATPDMAPYTAAQNDSVGGVAWAEMRQAFLDAGWTDQEIANNFWAEDGLAAALGRANDIDDFRGHQLAEGETLNVPAPPTVAEGASRQEAYDEWFDSLGSVSSDVVEDDDEPATAVNTDNIPGPVEIQQREEWIKAQTQSFMTAYLPAQQFSGYTGPMHGFLVQQRQVGVNAQGQPVYMANYNTLIWSTNVMRQRLNETKQLNGGRLPSGLSNLEQAVSNLEKELDWQNANNYNPNRFNQGRQEQLKAARLGRAVQQLHQALESQ